jgi:hypothetical protein
LCIFIVAATRISFCCNQHAVAYLLIKHETSRRTDESQGGLPLGCHARKRTTVFVGSCFSAQNKIFELMPTTKGKILWEMIALRDFT